MTLECGRTGCLLDQTKRQTAVHKSKRHNAELGIRLSLTRYLETERLLGKVQVRERVEVSEEGHSCPCTLLK